MTYLLAVAIAILSHNGSFHPGWTRNQIAPKWNIYAYNWMHQDENGMVVQGGWDNEPDETAFSMLRDLDAFGLDYKTADANWKAASSQWTRHDEIESWNNEMMLTAWTRDVSFRSSAWSFLSSALDPTNSHKSRLFCLEYLRNQIGNDAYMAGWMPFPTPQYRVLESLSGGR